MTEGQVDFVIPHMGRPEMLVTTLESIFAQQQAQCIGLVVVVTKNSEPLALPEHPKLRVLYRPDAGSISEQRNLGAAEGQSPWLAFLDADIQLSPDWLATCLALMAEKPSRVVVTAMQKDSDNAPVTEQIRTVLSNTKVEQVVQYLPGCNLFLRRQSHQAVGGFPEHLQTCEDSYYTERLGQMGELFCTARTYYIHLGEDKSLLQSFRKEIWRSEFNLTSLRGRKVPLREWPSILLPFWVLLAFLGVLAAVLKPVLLAPAVLLLFLPVVLFSLRLYRSPQNQVGLRYLLLFYTVYFAARAIGTLAGVRFFLMRKDAA